MEKETQEFIEKELNDWTKLVGAKIDNLHNAMDKRFENLKKVVGDYLELSSNLSMATIKANLKSV